MSRLCISASVAQESVILEYSSAIFRLPRSRSNRLVVVCHRSPQICGGYSSTLWQAAKTRTSIDNRLFYTHTQAEDFEMCNRLSEPMLSDPATLPLVATMTPEPITPEPLSR